MDFNRQNTQPNPSFHQPATPVGQPGASTPSHNGKRHRGRKLNFRWSTERSLVLIAAILVVFGLLWYFNANGTDEIGQVNKNEYQAIFLANGQVYFGKLVTLNNDYAKITHVFYLQVNQSVQPKQGTSSQSQTPTLIKLGNEIHGPEDAMMINRSQIDFWENLKPSGKVSQGIQQYYKNGGSSSTSTPASSTNSSTPNSSSTTPPEPSSTTPSPSSNPSTSTTPNKK